MNVPKSSTVEISADSSAHRRGAGTACRGVELGRGRPRGSPRVAAGFGPQASDSSRDKDGHRAPRRGDGGLDVAGPPARRMGPALPRPRAPRPRRRSDAARCRPRCPRPQLARWTSWARDVARWPLDAWSAFTSEEQRRRRRPRLAQEAAAKRRLRGSRRRPRGALRISATRRRSNGVTGRLPFGRGSRR